MTDVENVEVFNELPSIPENEVVQEVSPVKTEVAAGAEEKQTEPVAEVVAPKKTKKKRVLTDEEKERLKANLAKGRATSLANRRKKAQLKKIALEEKAAEEDEKIFQAYKKKRKPAELEEENSKLKKQLDEMRMQMEASKKQEIIKPVKVKQKREKSAAIEDSDDDAAPAPAPAPELIQVLETPKLIPPPKKKEMSKRDIMRMMKGL
jgi:uncharacterized phage infection (PIP) family protein YhgE